MKYFGTDGIRKKSNDFTPQFLRAVAKGLVNYAGRSDIKVLIGGDTRESTGWMIRSFEEAFETLGVEYSSVDVLPTPAIGYVFYTAGFDYAIDITASHNPYTDNGIKVFERGGESYRKISNAGEAVIEEAIDAGQDYEVVATELRESLHDEAVERYLEHLFEYVGEVDFSGLKVGLDCANGAMSVVNKTVFEKLGAEVSLINVDAEFGQKINADCGSTHIDGLVKFVKENKLDFGAAFDGDGDRCLMVDADGEIVDGDHMTAILAKHLGLPAAVVTVTANQGLLEWGKESGIHLEVVPVGDQHVTAGMRDNNISLGSEQNGHVTLPGEPTGDGMLTALSIAKVVAETGSSLHELASIITKMPQVGLNFEATPEMKEKFKTSDDVKKVLLEFEEKLHAVAGRLLARPSGTENLIRLMMWGNDEAVISDLIKELETKLKEIL
ncbi:MAG: phosphoglucosamine mutase [Candidatus Saccharibacteria bacterium]|nr:phosphoglucosamine mutase [Candidatus Saccharibacteria bacterium]